MKFVCKLALILVAVVLGFYLVLFGLAATFITSITKIAVGAE